MQDQRNSPESEIKDLSVTQQREYFARKRKNLRTALAFAREQTLELSRYHAGKRDYIKALEAGMKAKKHFREARRLIDDIESMQQVIENDCIAQIKSLNRPSSP